MSSAYHSHLEDDLPPEKIAKYEKMVIAYHNDLNKATLGMMSEQEMSVFFAICGKLRGHQEELMTFTFYEIEEMIRGNGLGGKRIEEFIVGVNSKLMKLSVYLSDDTDEKLVQMNMFSTFTTDSKEKTLKVRVNQDFLYILNNIKGNYTSFKLVNMLDIRGKYVKTLYRLLKQFEGTGYYRVSLDKFRILLGIPENFEMKNINQRVIKPAVEQLSIQFPNLKCKTQCNSGGRVVTDLIFTFSPTLTKDQEFEEHIRQTLLSKQ